jgi:ubiquinone/menaquinone biosynthesis C-methylase UbiE
MPTPAEERKGYYDRLAADYDQDRFANSYGRYLHRLEESLMQKHFAWEPGEQVLDLGCDTGRFMSYASHGVDESEMMSFAF